MPNLSLIKEDAQRLVGRLPEGRRRSLQQALITLCESHWQEEVRGPQPETPLARVLWSVIPPLVDLFLDLYTLGDKRLDDALQGRSPANGLALLVLAEIERGNAEGVRVAHDPMMVFESPPVPTHYIQRIIALLRGNLQALVQHPHSKQPPLWKALAAMSAHTKRCDSPAIFAVVDLLTTTNDADQPQDRALELLCNELNKLGVRFLRIDHDHIYFAVHGHEHKPVRKRQVEAMLFEIRQAWLG